MYHFSYKMEYAISIINSFFRFYASIGVYPESWFVVANKLDSEIHLCSFCEKSVCFDASSTVACFSSEHGVTNNIPWSEQCQLLLVPLWFI